MAASAKQAHDLDKLKSMISLLDPSAISVCEHEEPSRRRWRRIEIAGIRQTSCAAMLDSK